MPGLSVIVLQTTVPKRKGVVELRTLEAEKKYTNEEWILQHYMNEKSETTL